MNYRLLNEKEIKREGDERYLQISSNGNRKWTEIDSGEVGQVFGREWDDSPIRRDVSKWTNGIPPIGAVVSMSNRGQISKCVVVSRFNDLKCIIAIVGIAIPDIIHSPYTDLKPWSEDA